MSSASEKYAHIGIVFDNALSLKENIKPFSRKHILIMQIRNFMII